MYNFFFKKIRDAAILTNTYVAATVIDNAFEYNQLVILVNFTIGDLDSLELKVEISADQDDWYQLTNQSVSMGTTTITPEEITIATGGKRAINVPFSAPFIRVSAKGTGTVTDSSLALQAILHTT